MERSDDRNEKPEPKALPSRSGVDQCHRRNHDTQQRCERDRVCKPAMPANCLQISSHSVERTPNGVDVREHRAGRTDDQKGPEKFARRHKRPYGHRNHRVGQRRWHDSLYYVRLTCAAQLRAAESRTRSGPSRAQPAFLRRRGTGSRFSTAVSREFTASNIALISPERPASA